MSARQFIDSLDFARNGRELRGAVPVVEMPRLQDMLAAPAGEISFVLRGLQGRGGKPMLEVRLDGHCQLCCQRCMQSLAYPVKLVSQLYVIPDGDMDEPADVEDEIDSIPADTHMGVLALVEEEFLLSLPFAPKHPEGACHPAVGGYVTEENARAERTLFAALAELKNK